MRLLKRLSFIIFFFVDTRIVFSLSLIDLSDFSLESNIDVQVALNTYEQQILSEEMLNGSYVPSLEFSSTAIFPEEYNWESVPNYFDSNITFNQPFPGGTILFLQVDYNFDSLKFNDETYINQSPNITLGISQSLLPYWMQGELTDPVKYSFKLNVDYYYYQFLWAKKNVLLQLMQNYVNVLISLNEIEIYKKTVEYYNKELQSLKEQKSKGTISESKIIEVENAKWSTQQKLMASQTKYVSYIQALKTICGRDFNENLLETEVPQNFDEYILKNLGFIIDPKEKSYVLNQQTIQNSRILEKQQAAPTLDISVQPSWDLDTTKAKDWEDSWKDITKPTNLTVNVSFNLTPMFMGISKQNKQKYQIKINESQELINSYIKQKKNIEQQYVRFIDEYTKQLGIINNLCELGKQELKDYEQQLEAGTISQLEFDSVCLKVNNYECSKRSLELNIWLYKMFMKTL